jgi:hypothetical protein
VGIFERAESQAAIGASTPKTPIIKNQSRMDVDDDESKIVVLTIIGPLMDAIDEERRASLGRQRSGIEKRLTNLLFAEELAMRIARFEQSVGVEQKAASL